MSCGRRSVVAGLVPFGALTGHVVGYLLAGESAGLHGGHRHLQPTVWVAGVAATAALVLVAARPGQGRARLPLHWLVGAQMSVFLALEAAEHVVAGHGWAGLVTSPSLRWGLLAQVFTAAALVAAATVSHASAERVRALLGARTPSGAAPPRSSWPRAGSAFHASIVLASPASERGPPRNLVPG